MAGIFAGLSGLGAAGAGAAGAGAAGAGAGLAEAAIPMVGATVGSDVAAAGLGGGMLGGLKMADLLAGMDTGIRLGKLAGLGESPEAPPMTSFPTMPNDKGMPPLPEPPPLKPQTVTPNYVPTGAAALQAFLKKRPI